MSVVGIVIQLFLKTLINLYTTVLPKSIGIKARSLSSVYC